jgi:hypothetical protein
MLPKTHECNSLIAQQGKDEDTEIIIAEVNNGWVLSLFDGDMVATTINFCPYCGQKL